MPSGNSGDIKNGSWGDMNRRMRIRQPFDLALSLEMDRLPLAKSGGRRRPPTGLGRPARPVATERRGLVLRRAGGIPGASPADRRWIGVPGGRQGRRTGRCRPGPLLEDTSASATTLGKSTANWASARQSPGPLGGTRD